MKICKEKDQFLNKEKLATLQPTWKRRALNTEVKISFSISIHLARETIELLFFYYEGVLWHLRIPHNPSEVRKRILTSTQLCVCG